MEQTRLDGGVHSHRPVLRLAHEKRQVGEGHQHPLVVEDGDGERLRRLVGRRRREDERPRGEFGAIRDESIVGGGVLVVQDLGLSPAVQGFQLVELRSGGPREGLEARRAVAVLDGGALG